MCYLLSINLIARPLLSLTITDVVSRFLDTIFDSIRDLKTHQRGLEHSPLHGIRVTIIINSFIHIIYPQIPRIQPSSRDDVLFYLVFCGLIYFIVIMCEYFGCTYVCMSMCVQAPFLMPEEVKRGCRVL